MSGSKGHIVSSTLWDITQNIATCEEGIWISKSLKSGIQGFGIRNTAEGFLNPTNDWNQNPRFTDKGRNQVPGIRNPRCGIHSSRLSWIFLLWAKKKKTRIQNIQSKITAIDLGGQRWRKFKTQFRKISLWFTAYREHFDGILVIVISSVVVFIQAGTFAIQNRLEFYMEDLRKIRHQLWILHILIL